MPSTSMMMFAGFRSRWTTSRRWAYDRAPAVSWMMASAASMARRAALDVLHDEEDDLRRLLEGEDRRDVAVA